MSRLLPAIGLSGSLRRGVSNVAVVGLLGLPMGNGLAGTGRVSRGKSGGRSCSIAARSRILLHLDEKGLIGGKVVVDFGSQGRPVTTILIGFCDVPLGSRELFAGHSPIRSRDIEGTVYRMLYTSIPLNWSGNSVLPMRLALAASVPTLTSTSTTSNPFPRFSTSTDRMTERSSSPPSSSR